MQERSLAVKRGMTAFIRCRLLHLQVQTSSFKAFSKEGIMKITKLRKQILVSLALIALSILAVPAVKAQCGPRRVKALHWLRN